MIPHSNSSRRVRFFIWIVSVIGGLAGQILFSRALTFVSLGLIFLLLCTTPRGAIRLPRWISEMFILLSTAVVRQPRAMLPFTIHLTVLVVMLIALRLWKKSAWWAVLYGWFPG